MQAATMLWTSLSLVALFVATVFSFPEAAVRPRARFNYSSRPSATLQQNNPISNRVPDFSLIEENDEESTTRSPIELSFGYQFAEVSSGLDKRTEGDGSKKPIAVSPSRPEDKNPDGEEEESNEDNDDGRSRQDVDIFRVEDDEPPTTTYPNPPPPIGVHFYEVSSKLNEQKVVPVAAEEPKQTDKNPVAVEESEEEDDNSEEKVAAKEGEDPESRRGARQLGKQFSNIRQNVGCGYYRMRNGNVISFHSDNFNFSEYRNNQLCSWRFFGQHCIVRVSCPCFDVPPSSDCKEDHLKITDGYAFLQKFCGTIRPLGSYRSTTNNLNVWFKTDWQDTATGFFCYVTCAGPGQQEPAKQPVTCPTPVFPTPVPVTPTPTASPTINPSSIDPTATGQVGITPPFSPSTATG